MVCAVAPSGADQARVGHPPIEIENQLRDEQHLLERAQDR